MYKYIFHLFTTIILLLFAKLANGNNDSLIIVSKIYVTNSNYIDYDLIDNTIFAISDSGKLHLWNLESNEVKENKYIADASCIGTRLNGEILIGFKNGIISKYSNGKVIQIEKVKHSPTEIYTTDKNEIFVITSKGIIDLQSKKTYSKPKNLHSPLKVKKRGFKVKRYFLHPDCSDIDKSGVIWMGKSFGEFGSVLHRFDTNKKKFISSVIDGLNLGLLFPKSFFSDNIGNVYITSGLQHFIFFGDIIQVNKKDKAKFIISTDQENLEENSFFLDNEYIGPGTIDNESNRIFFFTHKGLYSAKMIKSKVGVQEVEFLGYFDLSWTRENLAIGYQMAVESMKVIDSNRIIINTVNNGIGVFNLEKNQIKLVN